MITLGRDINGNKLAKYSDGKSKGFSVQTLENMEKTHEMAKETLNQKIAFAELYGYVAKYGTARQKDVLGIYVPPDITWINYC